MPLIRTLLSDSHSDRGLLRESLRWAGNVLLASTTLLLVGSANGIVVVPAIVLGASMFTFDRAFDRVARVIGLTSSKL
jgi:hypothetical protein